METTILLAAGAPTEVQIARSGVFTEMGGGSVALTPETLAGIAAGFSAGDEVKLKIGHGPITTETPDYGDVTALHYDATKDRLFATIDPSEALVEKNRKERFRRVSMELARLGGKFVLQAVSFLGARKPAIGGLAPVMLAGPEGERYELGFVLVGTAAPAPPARMATRSAAAASFDFAARHPGMTNDRHERVLAYMDAHPEVTSYVEAQSRVLGIGHPLDR